jgi:hypothetical protein
VPRTELLTHDVSSSTNEMIKTMNLFFIIVRFSAKYLFVERILYSRNTKSNFI